MVSGDLDILNSENENTINISESKKEMQHMIQKEVSFHFYSLDIIKRIEALERD